MTLSPPRIALGVVVLGLALYTLMRMSAVTTTAATSAATQPETSSHLVALKSELALLQSELGSYFAKLNEKPAQPSQDLEKVSSHMERLKMPNGLKHIRSLVNNQCLDRNNYPNNSVKIWNCHGGQGGPYQSFWMTKTRLLKHPSGYCIQAAEGTGPVRVAFCNDKKPSQIWTLDLGEDNIYGFLRISNYSTCMDIDKDIVVTKPCSGVCTQRWHVSSPVAAAINIGGEPSKLLDKCDKEEP